MKNDYQKVRYNNIEYIVAVTKSNDVFVIDETTFRRLPDKLFYKTNTYIYTRLAKPTLLHHLVKPYDGVTVDHINQIKMDNRSANLRYATQAEQNQNQSKRKRNVELPEDCHIDPRDIPTFIWYIKDDGHHGDRWMVEIKGKYSWKTTSSKEFSTKFKFELAKKHLRDLIATQPDLLQGHCINGELSFEGEQLKKEYIYILELAGYDYENKVQVHYLDEELTGLTESEIVLLQNADDTTKQNKLPKDFTNKLPKYCYYTPENNVKGDGFCVGRLHPKQGGKDWTTTRSKKISTTEKYTQLMSYLSDAEYVPVQDVILPQKEKEPAKVCCLELPDEIYLTIFQLKNIKDVTTQDAAETLRKNFDRIIKRDIISKIWKSEIDVPENLKTTKEYNDMVSNNKQRTKKTKFTEDARSFWWKA